MIRGPLLRSLVPVAAAIAFACPGPAAAQTVTVTTTEGDMRIQVGAAASLPDDFPADVWLPEGQSLQRVDRLGATTTLTFDVAPGDGVLVGEYERRMRTGGWTPAHVGQPDAGHARAWEKDGRAVVAAFSANVDGGTRVRLQLLPRR